MRSVWCLCLVVFSVSPLVAADPQPTRLLLIAGPADGHPPETHEYVAGINRLQKSLTDHPGVTVRTVTADDAWTDGPTLLDGCDGAVLFRSEGAKWVSASPERHAAFTRLAKRQGGLAVLHWGMGTKAAEPIPAFTALFGGCHGGPDRKFQVVETRLAPSARPHAIAAGIEPFVVRDEFYYALKWPADVPRPEAVLQATIDGEPQTVAWAWDRPDGGRSFGFSGLHYHANWDHASYARLVTQGVLWTVRVPLGMKSLQRP
jgi:type 1 glutamine amidotransferase